MVCYLGDGVAWTFVVAPLVRRPSTPTQHRPGLKGYMAFYWDQMDAWCEEGNPIRIPDSSLERELVSTFLRRQEILVRIVLQLDGGKHRLDLMLALGKAPFGFLQVQRAVDERHVREGLRIVPQRHVGARVDLLGKQA